MKDDGSLDLTRSALGHSRYHCPRSPQLARLDFGFSFATGIFDLRSEPELSSAIVRRSVSCRSLRCSHFWSRFIDHVLDCAPHSTKAPSSFRSSLSRLAKHPFVRPTDRCTSGQLLVWRPRHRHSLGRCWFGLSGSFQVLHSDTFMCCFALEING